MKLSRAIDVYLTLSGGAAETVRARRYNLARLAAFLGDIKVAQITPERLESFQAFERARVSQNTWATRARQIHALFKWLVRENYILRDPSRSLDARRIPSARPRILTAPEERRLLAAASHRTRLRLLLALDAGLRRGEVIRLRVRDISLSHQGGLIKVDAFRAPRARRIPMTGRLLAETLLLKPHDIGFREAPLFHFGGDDLSILSSGDFMGDLCRRAGVRCRFHDLRHTFAARLAAVEPNSRVIRALLGGRLRAKTERGRVSLAMMRDAIRRLEAARRSGALARSKLSIPTTK